MSKKSRLLALLLTVLMVVGMLPLSVFAVEGTTESTGSAGEGAGLTSDWPTMKSTLEAAGYIPYAYQDFEGFTFAESSDTVSFESKNYWGKSEGEGEGITKGAYSYASKYYFGIKNVRNSFSVKKESDNNALYMGTAASSADNDNYVDYILKNAPVAAGEDVYVSIDLKMGSESLKNINVFTFLVRPTGGACYSNVVGVNPDGGIYINENDIRSDVVAYLSNTEYTRLSVKTDVANNLFYLYINNVLVNPNGSQLISDSILKNNVGAGKTAKDTPLTEVRCLNSTVNVPEKSDGGNDVWGGLYIDNLLFAGRVSRTKSNSKNVNVYTMDLSGVTEGEIWKGGAKVSLPGTSDIGTKINTIEFNASSSKSVVYFKEADGSYSIKYQKSATENDDGQTYLSAEEALIQKKAEYVGANWSFSVDVRAGSDNVKLTQILAPITRANGKNEIFQIGTDAKRQLIVDSKSTDIPVFIPTDKFINVEQRILCDSIDGHVWGYVYVDGVCVHRQVISSSTSSWVGKTVNGITLKNENDLLIWDFHFVKNYANAHINLAADDIHLKGLTVKMTESVATAARENPFEVVPQDGLNTTAGITRYFENGAFKTANFAAADGTSYAVKEDGRFIGSLSDGVVQSPYAAYSAWAHSASAAYSVQSANGGSINTGCMGINRQASVITNNGKAIYISYGAEQSYFDIGIRKNAAACATVIEFDLMPAADLSGKNVELANVITLKDSAGSGSSGNANRKDYYALVLDNGWLKNGSKYLQKLSDTEWTRVSIVVKPYGESSSQTAYCVYLNGVKVVDDLPMTNRDGTSNNYVNAVRMFATMSDNLALYVKNYYVYSATAPQQFCTMVDGAPTLTSDQDATPAKPSDIKSGFVNEDSVVRYYDPATGLPIISGEFDFEEKHYTANANGAVGCDGTNHLPSNNGKCPGCGNKSDGISWLYGNSLILGSDVKVVFYLDIDAEKAATSKAKVTFEGESPVIFNFGDISENTSEITEGRARLTKSGNFYKLEYAIAAKDVETAVKVQIIDASGETEKNGSAYTYSAAKYVAAVKAKPDGDSVYTAELKALCDALLTYGRNAKAVLTGNGTTVTPSGEAFEGSLSIEASGADFLGVVKLAGISLDLESNLKIKIYFKLDENEMNRAGVTVNDYTVTAGAKAFNAGTLTPDANGVYCIEYTVLAAQLNTASTFAVEAPSRNNCGIEFKLSAVQCAHATYNYYSTGAGKNADGAKAQADLALALKGYADAAAAYSPVTDDANRPADNA